MQCGLFGKLPAKRDFVSYNMPRPLLDHWENWLQAAIAESRHALADNWQNIFLTMPIWRFWCGPQVFGQTVTGAVMASVDGVGRYFPLSICACESHGEDLLPPPEASLEAWLGSCEQALLSMLEDAGQFDPTAILGRLGAPPVRPMPAVDASKSSVQTWSGESGAIQFAFDQLSASDQRQMNIRRGLWWTLGGKYHTSQLIMTDGPIQPSLWTSFMNGMAAT